MNTEERKRLRGLCENLGRREWRINPDDELCVQSYSEIAGVGEEWSDVLYAYRDGIPQAIFDLRAAVPALLDALDEAEADRDELKALDAEAQHGADEQTKQMLRLDAENAALRARVEKLEAVEKAAARFIIAEGLSRTGSLGEQLALDSFDVLKSAMDRAGEP